MTAEELERAVIAHHENERHALLAGDIDAARDHAARKFLYLSVLDSRGIANPLD
ncbi:hypothetical protein GS966_25680 [Rhodococcus hoagii]|nr:hypothetical protein [Prescottella equi]NKZ93234.1 hypothetical protein [Prescottella equi]NKZ93294.1 hypothetical protein [Prescottella equi]